MTPEDYLREIWAVADGRPAGSSVRVQIGTTHIDLTEATPDQVREAGFVHYRRPGATLTPSWVHIYIDPRPDATAAVIRDLVREVVDEHDAYPGVHSAKVVGWRWLVEQPADPIVVYVENRAAADRIRRWLEDYERRHPDVLDDATPAVTLPVMTGVALAAKPLTDATGSWGRHVSTMIKAALDETAISDDWDTFVAAAFRKLERGGVDLHAPHRNDPARQRRWAIDPLAALAEMLRASFHVPLAALRTRLGGLSDIPGTGVRARHPSELFSSDRLRRALRAISDARPDLDPALANTLPGLVIDLLLAGTARVEGQPLLPRPLLVRVLEELAREPAAALQRLGYRHATGVPDESFVQRLHRFGLLHLPADMVGPTVASPLFEAWLASARLGVMLAESARFGATSRVGAASTAAMGAVPVAALVAVVDQVVSMVVQRQGKDVAGLAAEVQALLRTVQADATRVARDGSRQEAKQRAADWVEQLAWALQRLAEAGLWARSQRPDWSTTPLVTTSAVKPPPTVDRHLVPDPELSIGELLAYLRGDVRMLAGFLIWHQDRLPQRPRVGEELRVAYFDGGYEAPSVQPGDPTGPPDVVTAGAFPLEHVAGLWRVVAVDRGLAKVRWRPNPGFAMGRGPPAVCRGASLPGECGPLVRAVEPRGRIHAWGRDQAVVPYAGLRPARRGPVRPSGCRLAAGAGARRGDKSGAAAGGGVARRPANRTRSGQCGSGRGGGYRAGAASGRREAVTRMGLAVVGRRRWERGRDGRPPVAAAPGGRGGPPGAPAGGCSAPA